MAHLLLQARAPIEVGVALRVPLHERFDRNILVLLLLVDHDGIVRGATCQLDALQVPRPVPVRHGRLPLFLKGVFRLHLFPFALQLMDEGGVQIWQPRLSRGDGYGNLRAGWSYRR